MEEQNAFERLLGSGAIKLEHEFDWDDILKMSGAIFLAVVLAIIVGHSILKSL